MNTTLTRTTIAAALFAVAASVAAQEVDRPVAVILVGVPDHLRAHIEEKARAGPTALRRYLDRTRHIHGLRFEVTVKPEDQSTMNKGAPPREPGKVAEISDTMPAGSREERRGPAR